MMNEAVKNGLPERESLISLYTSKAKIGLMNVCLVTIAGDPMNVIARHIWGLCYHMTELAVVRSDEVTTTVANMLIGQSSE